MFPPAPIRALSPQTEGLLHRERQVHQLAATLELKHNGVPGFQLVDGSAQIGESLNRCTVDGADYVAHSEPALLSIEGASNCGSDHHS